MSVSFDRAADFYDATRGYSGDMADKIRDAIVTHIGATPQTRFLEIGVGTGRIALPFIRAGYNYTGIDLSQPMMDKLNEKVAADSQASANSYTLINGDVTQLPFPDSAFDVVIAVHVLHLVSGWQKAVDEVKRVLIKPRGVLVSGYDGQGQQTENNTYPFEAVRRQWRAIVRKLGAEKYLERPGASMGGDITDYLQSLGANVEKVTLLRHIIPSLSARQTYQRIAERIYSEHWNMPDDFFQQSLEQLKDWLDTTYPNPDEIISYEATFNADIGRF